MDFAAGDGRCAARASVEQNQGKFWEGNGIGEQLAQYADEHISDCEFDQETHFSGADFAAYVRATTPDNSGLRSIRNNVRIARRNFL